MLSGTDSLMLVLLASISLQVTSIPINGSSQAVEKNDSSTPHYSTLANSSSLLLEASFPNDWEYFAYPIPNTRRTLRGSIFTGKPISPNALHYMIDGGLATMQTRLSILGDVRLRDEDNPFIYRVPGCYFKMTSKLSQGKAGMTYGAMRDVFQALEQLLEKEQRFFEVSFTLVDDTKEKEGHGEVYRRQPSLSRTDV